MTSAVRPRIGRAGLAVILLATFMGQVDTFVVNVAAPAIQSGLGADFDQLQLVITGYVVAYAAVMVTGGRFGDRWGRRRVFCWGTAGFTAASLACALAPTAGWLIAARVVQGAAAAVMIPQVLSLIRAGFPDDAGRARAVGAYGATIGLGVVAGLIGGGVLLALDVAGLGWRSIFLINVPVGIAIMAATPGTVAESRAGEAPALDLVGASLIGLVLPAVLLPLSLGAETGWSAWCWPCLAVAALLLGGLLAWERALARRGGQPIVPPRLLATRGIPLSLATVAVFFCGNAGLFLVLTYHLQIGLGLDALATGLAFGPLGVGFAVGSAVGKRLTARFGDRTATAGAVLMAVGLLVVPAVTGLEPFAQAVVLAAVIGVSGFGQGLVVARLLTVVLAHVDADDAGAGSGVVNTVTQAAMAAGVAVIGALYQALSGTTGHDEIASAFDVVALVLAALAVATAVLLERLRALRPRTQSVDT